MRTAGKDFETAAERIRRVSKVEVLRAAIDYIHALDDELLWADSFSPFAAATPSLATSRDPHGNCVTPPVR